MEQRCENWLKNSLSNYILWKKSNNITINFSNLYTGLICILKEKLPFQKIALVISEQTFFQFGKRLCDELKKIDNKVITLIMDSEEVNSKNTNIIFSLPEDVRAVVVFNNHFFDVASYYCSFTKTRLVAAYTSMEFSHCFKRTIYFKDNTTLYPYNINCDIDYIFAVDSIIDSPYQFERYISRYCSKLLAPIDYYFNLCFSDNKTNYVDINKIYSSVAKILKKLKSFPQKIDLELFLLSLEIEIINGMTNGKLFDCFSADIVNNSLILKKDTLDQMELTFATLFAKIYLLAFKGEYSEVILDSYSNRLAQIQEVYGISRKSGLNNYLLLAKKTKRIKLSTKDRNNLLTRLEKIYRALNYSRLILRSYTSQSKKIQNKHLKAVCLAGDLPKRANGLTFIIEKVI